MSDVYSYDRSCRVSRVAFIRLSGRLKDDIILIRREHPAVTCFMKLTTPNETAAVQKAMEKLYGKVRTYCTSVQAAGERHPACGNSQ